MAEVVQIPTDRIRPRAQTYIDGKLQQDLPRLDKIRESIRDHGVLVPLKGKLSHTGFYLIGDGNHRLHLARQYGFKTIPCEVQERKQQGERKKVSRTIYS